MPLGLLACLRRYRRPAVMIAAGLIGVQSFLAGASIAFAHITLENQQAPVGASYKAVLRVPHGCWALRNPFWKRWALKSIVSRVPRAIGISPWRRRAILAASLSTQTTSWPNWAKQAPDTSPT